jgi:hypothetical protein
MNAHPPRRSTRPVIPVLWVAALLAVCCSGTAIAAVSPSTLPPTKPPTTAKTHPLAGTWKGGYSGAYSGTFTLKWRQVRSRLIGTITLSNPGGTYRITGSVRRNAIKFGAVGVGATYTGKVSGKSMGGSYKTPGGGGRWSARKTS